ncbi:5-(carboxyamino)imidazole ribonucleotide synthase [Entomobacter blattae]|uniref:N5-carboxyaminoimidazole ribonucleotide synthase n=1 Tax=Entomobacter blattae TaxID=2762277 RepID=A0A7H1NS09_9PROT|nr:5-(carboxyamino)imidazole ribonucleotide synthase [Entomobacter blattae]QNT78569.1 N5-carboxyaminoimidazole ribonucleotide synthase [Entomobacter blattae]
MSPLPPGCVIGIIGGGQLGRMSATAAAQLGYHTHILSNDADCPARDTSTFLTIGSYEDEAVLQQFANTVDVVTFEFENISAKGLDILAARKPVHPSGHILRISQDRIKEKTFLHSCNIPIAPWLEITTLEDLAQAGRQFGYPFLAKTSRLGYDGKGQYCLQGEADLVPAFETLFFHPLVAEKKVDFFCEVSILVARKKDGEIVVFDPVENRHKNGILDLTLAPARLPFPVIEQIQEIGRTIAHKLALIGLLAIELFIDENGQVLVNEIAPRPHNSGHWTLDACLYSQFDLHIRAVANLPLPTPQRHSDAVMKNLIGPEGMALWEAALNTNLFAGHLYGKKETLPGRKMGHLTTLFPHGALPGEHAIAERLALLAPHQSQSPEE